MATSFVFVEETGDSAALNKKSVRRRIRQKARAHVLVEQLSQQPFVEVKDRRDLLLEDSNDRAAGIFGRHATAVNATITSSAAPAVTAVTPIPATIATTARSAIAALETPSLETESDRTLNVDGSRNILRCLRATGYERARMTYNADMLLLSALTTVHLGRGESLALGEKGSNLARWMKESKESSYLDFVPLFYDTSQLVRVVVDCLLCRIYLFSVRQKEAQSQYLLFKLYGKALKEMQQALDSPQRHLQPDVLLATAILQLFEVGNHYIYVILANSTSIAFGRCTVGTMVEPYARTDAADFDV
jgi:hypothetical protein